jgi:UDP-glucose 4-epimerase
VVEALEHVMRSDVAGIYNVAGDGVLALSEVANLLGKTYVPVLPPWGTGLAAALARRLGIAVPPEMLSQLRFGRGLDNRKLKATGFNYRYTTREAVIKLREHLRLDPILRGVKEPYQYERDVEDFLRWSPHVSRAEPATPRPEIRGQRPEASARTPSSPPAPVEPEPPTGPPVEHYDDLEAEEIISLLGSLEVSDLAALRDYEADTRSRDSVTGAIDAVLARRGAATRP